MLPDITAGWTGTLGPYLLAIDGTPIDLSGFDVVPIITRESGTSFEGAGTVTLLNQVSFPGRVTYDPATTDFAIEPYRYANLQTYHLHWKVTDSLGKVVYFPNGAPEQLLVARP